MKNCQKLQKILKIHRKNQKTLFIFQKKKRFTRKQNLSKKINVFAIVFFFKLLMFFNLFSIIVYCFFSTKFN